MEEQAKQDQSWWQKNKRLLIIATVIILVLLIVSALAVYLWGWGWTGFTGGESKVTKTPQGTNIEYSPGKTFWDWMQLLLVPIMLAIGVYWLNQIQKDRDKKAEEAQNRREEDAAKERDRVTTLKTTLDNMKDLILNRDLKKSKPEDEIRSVARAEIIVVVRQLDGTRKGLLIRFLSEVELLTFIGGSRIISLNGANLSDMDLRGGYLSKADLTWANLSHADLRGTFLGDTDLSNANLSRADLGGTNMSGANLMKANLKGAKMNNDTNLSGTKLQGAKYNKKEIQEMDAQGKPVIDQQGKPVMIERTQWPQGFDPMAAGATEENTYL